MPAPKNAPLYQQIYDEIKDAIEKGVYAPKERIPSELELAEQYEVSRITVRRAVEELDLTPGLIERARADRGDAPLS